MIYLIAYAFLVFLVLIFAILLLLYTFFSLIANFMGSPYVSTKQKEVKAILEKANLKPGQLLIELGSGDGRFLRTAVLKYQVCGVGVEINPILLFYAKILAINQKLKNITFKKENFYKTDLREANAVFLFLLPNVLKKLENKLLKECQKNTLIISHGFKIEGFQKYLNQSQTINNKPFPTYFYVLR